MSLVIYAQRAGIYLLAIWKDVGCLFTQNVSFIQSFIQKPSVYTELIPFFSLSIGQQASQTFS